MEIPIETDGTRPSVAVTHIMADDVDAAEDHLGKGSSPFHQLGKGVVIFIRATLGFEQEIMREGKSEAAFWG